jgi:hypothetical protein
MEAASDQPAGYLTTARLDGSDAGRAAGQTGQVMDRRKQAVLVRAGRCWAVLVYVFQDMG